MLRRRKIDDFLIEILCSLFGLEHFLVQSRTKVADVLGVSYSSGWLSPKDFPTADKVSLRPNYRPEK